MNKRHLNTLATLTALGIAFYPVLSYTHTLDPQFACKSNAHTFIAGLINDDSIDRDPTHVEANSVNAFRPAQGSDLTAFGYPVHDVFGYEHNDAMFKRGGGEALAGSLYGAVVSAPTEEVEARVRKAGSGAVVQEVVPLVLTAIVCNDH